MPKDLWLVTASHLALPLFCSQNTAWGQGIIPDKFCGQSITIDPWIVLIILISLVFFLDLQKKIAL